MSALPAEWWTDHQLYCRDAREAFFLPAASVDLIVTSPPYPMIQMWDDTFAALNPAIAKALAAGDGPAAFELMHQELDRVWQQCYRLLKPGGLVCLNIGDAVRTLKGNFRLYANHARILTAMERLGFQPLPDILWRKPTNAPNKFLGSGMLPAGAYVTYEHEYILIFRKGGKRRFSAAADAARRRASAFFWEERNLWFSDVWTDLRGTRQELGQTAARGRSAAYPLELPYRLICMFSLYGDVVFDPFLGTGTTAAAALAAGRHSLGLEALASLLPVVHQTLAAAVSWGAARVQARYAAHLEFVREREAANYRFTHRNLVHHFPVMTAQERELALYQPTALQQLGEHHFRAAVRLYR